jgi:hypothetical protein
MQQYREMGINGISALQGYVIIIFFFFCETMYHVSLPIIFKLVRPSLAQNKGKNKLHTASPHRDMTRFKKKEKMQKSENPS